MKLGVIGDDFTGSSDIGLMLAAPPSGGPGLATVQYVGVPDQPADPSVEAGVIALKSRSAPAKDAVEQSLAALAWLRSQGAETVLFKVCSTFDSTPEGNIGPVAEALVGAIGTREPVIVCPAFPATGRTIYQGHLFVGDRLLSESGLENHPLNPMTDPDIRRWLARQTHGGVGLVPWSTVIRGAEAVRDALRVERDAGRQFVICDAVRDKDLLVLGRAMVEGGFPFAVCGSGLALGLPELLGASGGMDWDGINGPAVALSGSCSKATRAQVAAHRDAKHPMQRIDVDDVIEGSMQLSQLADWAVAHGGEGAVPLLYTSDDPAEVAAVQDRHGRERSAEAIEKMFGGLARTLVERGVGQIISAGGETSGAVVTALGATTLRIGPAIDPGVPAVAAQVRDRQIGMALKSGNFGAPDFFAKAARVIAGHAA